MRNPGREGGREGGRAGGGEGRMQYYGTQQLPQTDLLREADVEGPQCLL